MSLLSNKISAGLSADTKLVLSKKSPFKNVFNSDDNNNDNSFSKEYGEVKDYGEIKEGDVLDLGESVSENLYMYVEFTIPAKNLFKAKLQFSYKNKLRVFSIFEDNIDVRLQVSNSGDIDEELPDQGDEIVLEPKVDITDDDSGSYLLGRYLYNDAYFRCELDYNDIVTYRVMYAPDKDDDPIVRLRLNKVI